MDNSQEYYVTYKFYDERGRRLSIFCVPGYDTVLPGDDLPEKFNKLFIYVVPCSNKDTFSKQRARELFDAYLGMRRLGIMNHPAIIKPIEFQVDVEGGKPKFTFIKWCEINFFKYLPTIVGISCKMLWRGNEQLVGSPMKDSELMEIRDVKDLYNEQSAS